MSPETSPNSNQLNVDGDHQDIRHAYFNVRFALGLIGLVFPIILLLHAQKSLDVFPMSVSHFYHTEVGDFFVGCLCAIGVFLFVYKDGDPNVTRKVGDRPEDRHDRLIAKICGASAIGVAFFPVDPRAVHSFTAPDLGTVACSAGDLACGADGFVWHAGLMVLGVSAANIIHLVFAAAFFVAIAFMFMKVFPDRVGRGEAADRGTENPNKPLYELYAGWIWVLLILLLVHTILEKLSHPLAQDIVRWLNTWRAFFVFEVLGIWIFAIGWITKSVEFRQGGLTKKVSDTIKPAQEMVLGAPTGLQKMMRLSKE